MLPRGPDRQTTERSRGGGARQAARHRQVGLHPALNHRCSCATHSASFLGRASAHRRLAAPRPAARAPEPAAAERNAVLLLRWRRFRRKSAQQASEAKPPPRYHPPPPSRLVAAACCGVSRRSPLDLNCDAVAALRRLLLREIQRPSVRLLWWMAARAEKGGRQRGRKRTEGQRASESQRGGRQGTGVRRGSRRVGRMPAIASRQQRSNTPRGSY